MRPERPQREPVSLEKFAQEDTMMKEFYEHYIVQNNVPGREEIFANARFFAIFSVQATKRGFGSDLADVMANRLDCYIWLLKKLGFKPGKSLVSRSTSGLNEMLSSIFYVVDTE